MKWVNSFINAVLAGICIGIGAITFLSVENKVIGAILFTVGLFTIVTNGLNLFTGKVCYLFERDRDFALSLPIIWVGNFVGAFLTGSVVSLTRISGIAERAATISAAKLGDNLLSIFILAVLCNILIFIAADGFSRNQHELGKYLSLFFGVVVFIICGFEHCIANMVYFTIAGVWNSHTFMYLIVMTLGNAVGGVLFPVCRHFVEREPTVKASKKPLKGRIHHGV